MALGTESGKRYQVDSFNVGPNSWGPSERTGTGVCTGTRTDGGSEEVTGTSTDRTGPDARGTPVPGMDTTKRYA